MGKLYKGGQCNQLFSELSISDFMHNDLCIYGLNICFKNILTSLTIQDRRMQFYKNSCKFISNIWYISFILNSELFFSFFFFFPEIRGGCLSPIVLPAAKMVTTTL